MNEPERGREAGKRNARYFGAEYQANRSNSTRQEYFESIAWYYGHESWDEMTDEERTEAIEEFNEGVRRETKHQKG